MSDDTVRALLDGLPMVIADEVIGDVRVVLERIEDFEAAVTVFTDRVLARRLPDAVFEDLCPMFGALWPAARALSERVSETELKGRRIIELGCGLALPSLVAAKKGARVVATDQHPGTEPLLRRNMARNQVFALQFASFDWRGETPPGVDPGSFEVVMASDVLYARTMGPLVIATIERFLAPGGVAWIADPGRAWLDDFAEDATERGFEVDMDVIGPGEGAFVLELRR